MDIEKAREYVTHRLNGELNEQELAELNAFLAEHPDFAEEVKAMEAVWEKVGMLRQAGQAAPPMGRTLRRSLDRAADRDAPEGIFRLRWIAVAAGVLLAVGAGVFLALQDVTREAVPPPVGVSQPKAAPAPSKPAATDGFANIDFPEVQKAQAAGGQLAAQAAQTSRHPWLLRGRGLILAKGPEDRRWRVLRRGDELAPNTDIGVPATPDFGAVLVGDDGSAVTLPAGSVLRYLKPRHWTLTRGNAWFDVGPAKDAAPFVVDTPQGTAAAQGTAFGLALSRKSDDASRPPTVICEVDQGKVELVAKAAAGGAAGARVLLDAGKSGILDSDGARAIDTSPGSKDWLARMRVLTEADESIARLVAEAEEAGKQLPLELKSYNVDVTVIDGVARTFIDMVFINHTERRLEGTFYYTVPAEATISEFAMYVGDQRIVGEVLEQQRARQIYEYIRREQRDPALLEWAGGNLFKMRVFPIEPKSEKRVQLGYTQVLRRVDGLMSYTFPLMSEMLKKTPLKQFGLELKVLSSPGIINLHSPTHPVQQGMSKDETRGAMAFQAANYTPDRDFKAVWAVPASSEFVVLTNRRPDEPEGYFMAQVCPRVEAKERSLPDRIIVIVDGSASVDVQSFNVAREFAGAVVEMVTGWDCNIVLGGQDTVFMFPTFRPSESGDYDRVKDFLGKRVPLGGTDLLKVFGSVAKILPAEGTTSIVYLGDGIDTLGRLEGTALVNAIVELFQGKKVEVSCVTIGSSYDTLVLATLAERLGGTFQSVQGVHDVFDAADVLLDDFSRPVLRELDLAFEGVKAAALYPPRLGTLSRGETGLVLGRIVQAGTGKATLSGLAEGKPFQREYPVNLAPPEDQNQFLPRLWAKAHMDSLRAQMGLGGPARDGYLRNQIIATSIRYQIMSPFTAFLVLESEEDYKRFGIVRQLRMVDWKGELAGVSHTAPGVVSKKPAKRPAGRIDWRLALLPEPRLNLAPDVGSQTILDILKILPQEITRQDGQASAGAGGRIHTTPIRRKGGGEVMWALQSKTDREDLSGRIAMGGRDLWIVDTISLGDEGGDAFGSLSVNGPVTTTETASEIGKDFSEFLGEEAEEEGQKLARAREGKLTCPMPFTENEKKPMEPDMLALDDDLGDLLTEAPAASKPKSQQTMWSNGEELDRDYFGDIDGRFDEPLSRLEGMAKRRISGFDAPGDYRTANAYGARRRGGRGSVAAWPYSQGEWRSSPIHRYGLTEIDAGGGEMLRIDSAWQDEGYLRRAVIARPDSKQARLDLAISLLRNGKCRSALKEMNVLLQAVSSPHLWLEQAWLQTRVGEKDAAAESVQTAANLIDAMKESERDPLRERVAQELANLGQYAEAARRFEALAEAPDNDGRAASLYGRAFSCAQSAGDKEASTIWERATQKWPQSATMHLSAASSLQSLNPDLALQYAARAQELGANTTQLRATILFNQKKTDDAWALLEQAFQTAANGSEAYQRLYECYNRDRRRASQWAEQALAKGTGPQMEGAVQFLQSYHINAQARQRVLELALQDDFPANLRVTAFYTAHRHGNRNDKCAQILVPLLRSTETEDERQRAVNALQQLTNYGHHRIAAPYLDRLATLRLENESWQCQLAQARYQIEWNTGKQKEAVDSLESAFKSCKDGNNAYGLANTMIYPLIQRGDAAHAVDVVADMFNRFPDHPNNRYLYRNLAQNLGPRGQLALLKSLQEKLAKEEENPRAKALTEDYRRVLEKLKEKKFAEGENLRRGFEATLLREKENVTVAIRRAVADLKNLAEKRQAEKASPQDTPGKPPAPPAGTDPAKTEPRLETQGKQASQPAQPAETDPREQELRKALDDRLFEFSVVSGLLRSVRNLQLRIAAMDEALRTQFFNECAKRAKSEDPVWREWTHARLACLRMSGPPEAYTQALEALCQSEPQDPIWPRMLANAYLTRRETEKALGVLETLCATDPEDVQLALSRHALVEASGDRDAVSAGRKALWQALKAAPNLLQQLAQEWQQRGTTDLAVEAYQALMEAPGYQDNAWYLVQAAQLLQGSGQRDQAARVLLRVFEKPSWVSGHGTSAVETLRTLMADEAILLTVEKSLPGLLGSNEPAVRGHGLLLAYHAAKIRNKPEEARKHIDTLRQMAVKDLPNLAQTIVSLLATEKEYDWLAVYIRVASTELKDYALQNIFQNAANALQSSLKDVPKAAELITELVRLAQSPETEMNSDSRSQVLANLASTLGQQKETRDKAIAIYRELIRSGDSNVSHQAYQIVNWLVDDGKISEAMEEARRFPVSQDDWNQWYAYDRIIQHVGHNKQDYALAARIALECWKKFDGNIQNYGGSAFDRFLEMGWRALEKKNLPDDLKKSLIDEVLAYGKLCFQGDPSRAGCRNWPLARCVQALGLSDEFRKMAEEAGRSDDPQRVHNAAQFMYQAATQVDNRKDDLDFSARAFQRLLQMQGIAQDLKVSALGSLYSLYTNYGRNEWDNAIEVLETWKDTGNLNRQTYLNYRVQCLYKLKRNEEARKAARELLQMPDYRRHYWYAQNIANYCREAADYAMEVECLEQGIRWMRLTRQIEPSYVSQFYVAIANAYQNLKEKGKSYEALLRGMSLLNRNSHRSYYENLMNNLMEFLKRDVQGGLDAVVAHYEKNMTAKGEMPHLRVAFGEAYRKEGNERKALEQLEIAARLLPQDTALRQDVVQGYQRVGENARAESALLSWAQLDPQNVDLYRALGDLYEKMSARDRALEAFATMAEVRPREAEGYRAYAQVLAARKMPDQAAVACEKAVRYRPTEFAIADELANLYRQAGAKDPQDRDTRIAGLWKEGESACRRAMDDLPDDPMPWLNLARFLKAQGKKAEARELINDILAREWPRFRRETCDEARQIQQTLN